MHHRTFSRIPGLNPLHAHKHYPPAGITNMSLDITKCPLGAKLPLVRMTTVDHEMFGTLWIGKYVRVCVTLH